MHGNEVDDFFPATLDYFEASRVAFSTRGLLHCVTLAADGGNTGATLYNGSTNKATKLLRIVALSGDTITIPFTRSVYLGTGLYVELDDANAKVSVEHSPVIAKTLE